MFDPHSAPLDTIVHAEIVTLKDGVLTAQTIDPTRIAPERNTTMTPKTSTTATQRAVNAVRSPEAKHALNVALRACQVIAAYSALTLVWTVQYTAILPIQFALRVLKGFGLVGFLLIIPIFGWIALAVLAHGRMSAGVPVLGPRHYSLRPYFLDLAKRI